MVAHVRLAAFTRPVVPVWLNGRETIREQGTVVSTTHGGGCRGSCAVVRRSTRTIMRTINNARRSETKT